MSSTILPKIHRSPHEHVSHKRHVLTLEERIAVLKYLEEHPKASISEVCSRFASNPRTVRRIQDKRDTLLTLSAGDKRLSRTRLTKGTCLPVESCVLKWMDLALFSKFSITNHTLQNRAKFFFSMVKKYIPKVAPLSASNGWINRFKVRNAIDLKELNKLGLESFSRELAPFREGLFNVIHHYSTNDIFTFTTTVLFHSFIPTINHTSPKDSDAYSSPAHLSLYLCSNASGSEKSPPSILTPFSFIKNDGLNVNVIKSSTGRISSQCFKSWLCYFSNFINNNRRVLLILDYDYMKICSEVQAANLYPNIEFKFLPQFHSNQVQPFNFGILSCFKSFYRANLIGEAMSQKEFPTEDDFSSFNIPDSQALKLVHDAWLQVPSSIIKLAWNYSGLLPTSHTPEINSDYMNYPDPFCMLLNAYPYIYSIVCNYDKVEQVHMDNDGYFPTEYEVLIVEQVVESFLESHPLRETKPENIDNLELKPEFPLHINTTCEMLPGDSKEFLNFPLEELNYIDNLTSFSQPQDFRDPVSCAVQASLFTMDHSTFCQSDSGVISPEFIAPYFANMGNFSSCPSLPSSDQIQNVDMLLQLLKSHLSSGFGAPSDITAALDFVSQYVHQFDENSS